MSRTISRIASTAIISLAILLSGSPAHAQPAPTPAPTDKLNTVIGNITGWVVGIAFGVATLFATIGFLRYLAAGGDPAEVEKAKSAWKNAAIGYAGALLAPVLLAIVKGWLG